jgi:hypothetical protein
MKPADLLKLMDVKSLNPRVKVGPEDHVCAAFVSGLRAATLEGRLDAVWTHPANELCKADVATAIARVLGLIPGSPDYWFIWKGGGALLEAKAGKNTLSPPQKSFRAWADAKGVPFYVFYSAEEGFAILEQLGVLRR